MRQGTLQKEQTEDRDLILRIREGDKSAENELFSRFAPRIDFMVNYKLGKNNDEWKDVANNIKMAVLTNLRADKFDLERNVGLESYIAGIVRNQTSKYFRKKTQERIFVKMDPLPDFISNTTDKFEIETNELREILRELIERLDLKYQEVLYLKYFEELKPGEISKRLNLPTQRVYERLNYAVKLLQKECKKRNFSQYLDLIE